MTLNAQLQTPGVARRVYLYRIGKELGVEDPTYGTKSEYRGIYIFGPDWHPRRVLLTYYLVIAKDSPCGSWRGAFLFVREIAVDSPEAPT